MIDFGITLKKLRIEKQLTQSELASKVGFSKSAISMYENGKREPDFEVLEIFADFFNVNLMYLIGSESDRNESITIAAHHDGEDWTEEELKEIEWFKELVRAKRAKKE